MTTSPVSVSPRRVAARAGLLAATLSAALALAACGGGSSADPVVGVTPVTPPVVTPTDPAVPVTPTTPTTPTDPGQPAAVPQLRCAP